MSAAAGSREAGRRWLVLAGVYGALAVGLGAFGAHALEDTFGGLEDGSARLAWWTTAAHYHLAHALALGLAAQLPVGRARSVAAIAFALGVPLFSGSLYAMALSGERALGAITPLGGVAFLVGWFAIALSALRR